MEKAALLQLSQDVIDEIEAAYAMTKETRASTAIRTRLRTARLKAASINYHLKQTPPEGFLARLRGFLKELA